LLFSSLTIEKETFYIWQNRKVETLKGFSTISTLLATNAR